VTTAYTYDANGQPSTIETKQGATTYLRMDYDTDPLNPNNDCDALGNPTVIKASAQGITTTYECYTYDALGRIKDSVTAITPPSSG